MKKIVSLALCLAMLFSLSPMGSLKLHADVQEPEIIWLNKGDRDFYFSDYSDGLIISSKLMNGALKHGMFDQEGKELLEPKYNFILPFQDGLASVFLKDDSDYGYGFIDKTGKEVIPCKYKDSSAFSEGLAAVAIEENGAKKWGYIDKSGKTVIPFQYTSAQWFCNGLAAVGINGKWGIIDKKGNQVIPPKYDYVDVDWEGDGVGGRYNNKYSPSLIPVHLNGKIGFINEKGEELQPFIYDFIWINSNGSALVGFGNPYEGGTWGLIDKNGKELIPVKYERIFNLSEGVATAGIGNFPETKWGFLDEKGNTIIDFKYDDAHVFSEGLVAVGIGDFQKEKWGFIDKTGKEVIPFKFDEVGNFQDGLAVVGFNESDEITPGSVGRDRKYGIIDKTGKEVVAPKYRSLKIFSDKTVIVSMDGKWGIMKNPLAKASAKSQDSEKPQAPINDAITAKYSISKLSIDGVAAQGMEIYNIGGNNYFKLRDVAKLFDGTDKKFSVGWNNEKKLISLVSGQNYVVAGGELSGGDGKDKSAVVSTAKMELNSKEVNLKAYTIAGNNYFKLRDLCEILGVKVDWDQATQTILLKTK